MTACGAPRALLWDNDGVLVDSEVLFLQASREILAGYDVEVTEDLYVDFSMRKGRSLFELIADQTDGEEHVGRIRATRDARYAELLEDGVPVLTKIEGARFKRIVKPGETIATEVRVAERLGPAWYLSAKVTCDGETVLRIRFVLSATAAMQRAGEGL